MKKLFKNKKILLSLAVAGIIAASGLTYAWFRQTIETQANNVNMGALHLNAEVTPWNEDDYHYEPGEAGYTTYAFTNPKTYATIPTVDALVKLNTIENTFVRLVDWEAWEALNDEDAPLIYKEIRPVDPELFVAYLEMNKADLYDLGNGEGYLPIAFTEDGMVAWTLFQTNEDYNLANGLTTPEVYLYIAGGRTVDETVVVPTIKVGMKLVGEGVDNNEYMGAELLYGSMVNGVFEESVGELVATQVFESWTTEDDDGFREFIEGAPYSEWGVTTDDYNEFLDVELFDRNAAPGTVSTYSVGVASRVVADQLLQKVIDQIRN